MNLEKFFGGDRAKEIVDDLQSAGARLHSTGQTKGRGPVLDSLGPPRSGRRKVILASLPGREEFDVVKRIAASGAAKQRELINAYRPQLYSIVFAHYRPGIPFPAGHLLGSDTLTQRINRSGQHDAESGGVFWSTLTQRINRSDQQTWAQFMAGAGKPWPHWIATLARQCCRLDQKDGRQSGSATLLRDGRLLTARHVIHEPGWLFGNPPRPAELGGRVRYNRVAKAGTASDVEIATNAYKAGRDPLPDVALLEQPAGWEGAFAVAGLAGEFVDFGGLELEERELTTEELKRRKVAVIGHPLAGNEGGDAADIPIAFADGELGIKRFMPGLLDDEDPLVHEDGQQYLKHDCSTLGGASGACLIDLESGKIIGIHTAGHAIDRNRAVPSWVAVKMLAAPEWV